MSYVVLLAAHLLQLTGPEGQVIYLDSDKVTTLRVPRNEKNFAPGTHCHIFTVDGKNINVQESCEQVQRLLGR